MVDMSYNIYLSYSGRKSFLTCPRQYRFRYVDKEKSYDDPRKAMLGIVVGKVFEWFYEEKYWTLSDPVTASLASISRAIEYTYSDKGYSAGTDTLHERELRREAEDVIRDGIDIIRTNGFLTPVSRAEVDLTVSYSPPGSPITVKMGGRADFIHGKSADNVWILDGKASKHREKYVDANQLIWYATQHYLKHHVAPSRLGFVFWCFPKNPVSWVEYGADSMRGLVSETMEVAKKILDKDFPATPSGECHKCSFRSKCDEGNVYLAKRRLETGGRIDMSVFDVERVT